MRSNNTTNETGEYDPPASAAEIYSDLESWKGARHDLNGEHICVTSHAQQRFLERVNGSEPFPRSRIEREFREAYPVELDDPRITDPTRLHPGSGAVYVFDPDDSAVLTCFIPNEEQQEGLSTNTHRDGAARALWEDCNGGCNGDREHLTDALPKPISANGQGAL